MAEHGLSPQEFSKPFPLIGRERERALLARARDAMLSGEGRLVLVSGGAGIGKTALVTALVNETADAGALVLAGHCYDLTAAPAYDPWRAVAEEYRPHRSLPDLPAVLQRGIGMGEITNQTELFTVAREFFWSVADVRPLLLVLEDLHWSDPESMFLLRYLARHLMDQKILIVATYRDDEVIRKHQLFELLPVLVRESDPERIDLRPLSGADVTSMVRHRYQLGEPDLTRLGSYLQEHGEGNPLFTRELLRTLEEERYLRQEEAIWTLGDVRHVQVPGLLRQLIERRLERLSDEQRSLLEVAAVIGQEVPLDLWQVASQASDEVLIATVEQAIEAHVVNEGSHRPSVGFTHALIREALYAGIVLPWRRKLHQAIAEALLADPAPDPDTVSYHLQQAGDHRAVDWLIKAGDRSQRTYAWLTAAERLDSALRLLAPTASNAPLSGWLCYRIGRLYRFANPKRGIGYLEQAEHIARECGDQVLRAFSIADRGMIRNSAGEIERGLQEVTRGIRELDGLRAEGFTVDQNLAPWVSDSVPAAFGRDAGHEHATQAVDARRGGLVVWLAKAGHINEAIELGTEFVESITSSSSPGELVRSSYADAQLGIGLAYSILGRPLEAQRACARAREAYREIGHYFLLRGCPLWELADVTIPFYTTNLEERRERLAEANATDERIEKSGSIVGEIYSDQSAFYLPLLLLEGHWNEARTIATAGLDAQISWHRSHAVKALARLAHNQGEPELSWEMVSTVLPQGPSTEPGDCFFVIGQELQGLAFDLALDAGDGDTAHEWLDAHDRWLDRSGAVRGRAEGSLRWARHHRWAGNLDLSRQHAERALAHATDPEQPLALIGVHRFLGELDTADRRYDEGDAHLRTSLGLGGASAAPFERALTLLSLAEIRAATRDVREAQQFLDEVVSICEPLAAGPTLERAARLRQRLAGRRPRAKHPSGLTQREIDVLRLVTRGMSDREIAEDLFISHHTVMRHVSSILHKLNVESRAAAAAQAVRREIS